MGMGVTDKLVVGGQLIVYQLKQMGEFTEEEAIKVFKKQGYTGKQAKKALKQMCSPKVGGIIKTEDGTKLRFKTEEEIDNLNDEKKTLEQIELGADVVGKASLSSLSSIDKKEQTVEEIEAEIKDLTE